MGEISMSGSTREREAAVIGLWAFHPVLSSLLYRLSGCFGLIAAVPRCAVSPIPNRQNITR